MSPATTVDIENLIKGRKYQEALAELDQVPAEPGNPAERVRVKLVADLLALRARRTDIGDYKGALKPVAQLSRGARHEELQRLKFRGLANARLGHREVARKILQALKDLGELDKDADTLGILARTWMDYYDRTGVRKRLIISRDLYQSAYAKAEKRPVLWYLAINTAAKSAFLGEPEPVRKYCDLAENALNEATEDERDYWHAATLGEVELLRQLIRALEGEKKASNYRGAVKAYRAAVNRFPDEVGSHSSTWLQAKRLLRVLTVLGRGKEAREAQNQIWEAFGHILDAPPDESVSKPPFRRLRAFAFDPSLARSMETAVMNEVVLPVRWETHPEKPDQGLPPGPIGEYLEVVDFDPPSGCFYDPIDLDDRQLLATDGMAPSESDPRFHQQMVYAVAMKTIEHFEQALGRPALWAERQIRDDGDRVVDSHYVQRLRIYPHALREANAYYSPEKKALLFGYFPAETDDPRVLPGGIIFACLSHDVVAHETTHALLDGLHPRFVEATNRDVLAFHEAFADIVALFQHFSHAEVLRHEIARSRGDLASGTLLGQLAQEFGRAIGNYGALRDAIGEVDPETREWRRKKPNVEDLREAEEPHARGAILVAAVFDAFLAIYNRRTEDLLRIATQGSGILEPGAIHPDLVERLADEAAKVARHVLRICIRALDYCPPVDLTFGDYLRAMITADVDMVPDDRFHYRLAIIEAFQRRGIYPDDVRNLSVESLVWRPPRGGAIDLTPLFESDWEGARLSPEWRPTANRRELWEKMNQNARAVWWWLDHHCTPDYAEEIGLKLSVDAPGSFYRSKRGVPTVEVHSVRVARRGTPEGGQVTDLVVEIMQRRRGYLKPEKQERVDAANQEPKKDGDFKYRGGCTLLIDPATCKVRYAITKHIQSNSRLRRQRAFLNGEEAGLRATYLGDTEHRAGLREPFAVLHQSF